MGKKPHFRNILLHSLKKFIFTLVHTIKPSIMPSEESSRLKDIKTEYSTPIKHYIKLINNNDSRTLT